MVFVKWYYELQLHLREGAFLEWYYELGIFVQEERCSFHKRKKLFSQITNGLTSKLFRQVQITFASSGNGS
jgi:hypothetical protein